MFNDVFAHACASARCTSPRRRAEGISVRMTGQKLLFFTLGKTRAARYQWAKERSRRKEAEEAQMDISPRVLSRTNDRGTRGAFSSKEKEEKETARQPVVNVLTYGTALPRGAKRRINRNASTIRVSSRTGTLKLKKIWRIDALYTLCNEATLLFYDAVPRDFPRRTCRRRCPR